MKPESQEVRKLVEEIQDLESEIYQLEEQKMRAEYRLDQLVIARSSSGTPTMTKSDAARPGRAPSETSAKKRITKLLNENPATDFDADMVSKRLGIHLGTVRTNLSKLVGPKYMWIEKRSANTYGALTINKKETPEEIPFLAS